MTNIQVVYENGVFRPVEPVVLPEGTEAEVHLTLEPAASEEKDPTLARLLEFSGVVNDLPDDMAAQHDHYIHGTPKR
ncbi:MAG TPA: antitoxin family protein [Pirellulales bacterium]|jgi:predicted DNA-binding antitoxin AbrB/MazE fold protein|nr:antitoxin family protein [Pirellulales bacterium]